MSDQTGRIFVRPGFAGYSIATNHFRCWGFEQMKNDDRPRDYRKDTLLTHTGRNPEANHGVVNPPVWARRCNWRK